MNEETKYFENLEFLNDNRVPESRDRLEMCELLAWIDTLAKSEQITGQSKRKEIQLTLARIWNLYKYDYEHVKDGLYTYKDVYGDHDENIEETIIFPPLTEAEIKKKREDKNKHDVANQKAFDEYVSDQKKRNERNKVDN